MADYPLISIDQLNLVANPARDHVLAAMQAGASGGLTVAQILGLAEIADVAGLSGDLAAITSAIDLKADIRQQQTSVSSAATVDLGAIPSENIRVTGSTAITSFGTAQSGVVKFIRFAGSLTLTHNGTSMILPNGGASIVTAQDDACRAISLGSGNWAVTQYQRAVGLPAVQRGHIYGLEASNGSDAVNDLNITAGQCASDSAMSVLMDYAGGTVELDAAFGVGNGGRFDNAISDGTWHYFVVSNGSTTKVGASKSLNPTSQPNYPAGYSYRRIFSWLRVSGSLVAAIQTGDNFMLSVPVQDSNTTNQGTSAQLVALTIPSGIAIEPVAAARITTTSINASLLITSPLQLNSAPGALNMFRTVGGGAQGGVLSGLVTISGQLRTRLDMSDASTTVTITTFGWKDARGR